MAVDDIKKAEYLILNFFDGDVNKTIQWFKHLNPLLGGISADYMIKMGREKKLLKFIEQQLELNEAPDK